MSRRRKVAAFARRHKWKLIHGHLAAAAVALLVAFLAGVFATGAAWKLVNGQPLSPHGQDIYHHLAEANVEHGQRTGSETPPPAVAAKIAEAVAALPHVKPLTLATPEPQTITSIVRNYSARQPGTRPELFVIHDAEMPNCAGTRSLQCLRAIAAWFNNPSSQASSNYSTDADGNTILMVPTTKKAWTQAFFNSWSISDELLGYASQTRWPDAQLRAVAQIAALDMLRYGIPIQAGAVHGCTIVRPGIVQHSNLGQCGGGHHDAGPHFPISRFIGMVRQYAAALRHPPKPAPKPKPSRTPARVLRAKTGYWAWLSWRLGEGPWKHYTPGAPAVRPHVPAKIPARWWRNERAYMTARKGA